jgi:chlorite dismutase
MGREYPGILTNTISSFGIADHEFVVAFESDDVAEMVKMVEYLRPAASRPYTKLDTPILLGVLKELPEVLADLG